MQSCLVSILLAGLEASLLFAQDFERVVEGIPFERDGQIAAFPFFGGLNVFLPQFVDLDGDGDLDLFLAESNEENWRLHYFENRGAPQAPALHWRATPYDSLRLGNWFALVDIDADGDADLYCANSGNGFLNRGGLRFYRNTGGSPLPAFIPETEQVLDAGGEMVANEPTSIPTFADIDADGDFDFFTGVTTGTIRLYRNNGTPAAPLFTFETETWQNLLIISGGRTQSPAGGNAPETSNRHGANGICFVDFDSDNDQDFFYGDLFHSSVYFLRNDGTPENARVAITDSLFPRPQFVQTDGFNIPRFADLDGDGDPDFFAASIQQQQGQDNFLHYLNVGGLAQPQFFPVTENFLTMLDVGSANYPALADLDADGDQDLLMGDDEGYFIFYRNDGTPGAPAWRWVSDNFQDLRPGGFFAAAPAFVDIDGDGDVDLFSGYHFGRLAFFENLGTPQQPQFALITTFFANIDGGDQSTPHFADIDHDGDYDLFVGDARRSVVYLYENAGTAQLPSFLLRKQIRPPFILDETAPCTYDWNGDGFLDLFAGNQLGTIVYFQGTARPDSFIYVDKSFAGIDVGFASAPLFTDLDRDGKIDLLVGERAGGLNFFRGRRNTAVHERSPLPETFALTVHPNPVRTTLKIIVTSAAPQGPASAPTVTIFNIAGARLAEIPLRSSQAGLWRGEWRPSLLQAASGVYFACARLGSMRITRKLLLVH